MSPVCRRVGSARPYLNRAPTVEAINAALGRPRADYDPDALIAEHARGTVFDPLTETVKARLHARYARDCASLAVRPDIVWLGGT